QQLAAHRADLGADGVRHHLGKPAWIDDLYVIVDEPEHFAASLARAEVVDRGKVEGCVVPDYPGSSAVLQLLQVLKRARLHALVVYDENLEARIRGLLLDGAYRPFEKGEPVPGGDDQRYGRRGGRQGADDAISRGEGAFAHGAAGMPI